MARRETADHGGAAAGLTLPAELIAAEAVTQRERLLDAISATRTIEIEIEGDTASPSALQLLAATRRMAARDGLDLRFGQRAAALLDGLGGTTGKGD